MAEHEKLQVIIVHSAKYQTTYTKKYENRKVWVEPNMNHINSYIPGTIVEILVKEGQDVKAGQSILILDAMKMLNNIKMPFSGKILKVNVEVGQKIPKNFLMIEIAPVE
jgi:biotin carboxyl carrier protein